jgi:hypothetical protein
LIEEIDRELGEAVSDLVHLAERLSLLAELQQVAVRVELRLGRPVTVFDVFDAARTDSERRRLERLARCLRGDT